MDNKPIPNADSHDFSPTERALARLWTEVLQLTHTPHVTDNFFSLGGDSMAAITLEFRIHEELAVNVLPGTLFGAPTLDALSRMVDSLLPCTGIAQDSPPSTAKEATTHSGTK